jgi:hypothetical protein
MRSTGSCTRFVGLLAVLALLSSLAALSAGDETDTEPPSLGLTSLLSP